MKEDDFANLGMSPMIAKSEVGKQWKPSRPPRRDKRLSQLQAFDKTSLSPT